MSDVLLVTGGTGLTGSTIALQAARQGREVRVLVRGGDTGPLAAAGIEVRTGDVTDSVTLDAAMAGVSQVVNTAAVLSGTWVRATPEQMWAVNHDGALNVLEAAARAGVTRCVHIDSNSIWDTTTPLTERSPLIVVTSYDSPYVAAKRAAYAGALHRVTRGQDIVFVTPGAIYGPGVFTERALDPTSLAGSGHRVRDIRPSDPDAPDIGTMRQFTERRYATPLFDDSETVRALGYHSTPRAEGLAVTVKWLRAEGRIREELTS